MREVGVVLDRGELHAAEVAETNLTSALLREACHVVAASLPLRHRPALGASLPPVLRNQLLQLLVRTLRRGSARGAGLTTLPGVSAATPAETPRAFWTPRLSHTRRHQEALAAGRARALAEQLGLPSPRGPGGQRGPPELGARREEAVPERRAPEHTLELRNSHLSLADRHWTTEFLFCHSLLRDLDLEIPREATSADAVPAVQLHTMVQARRFEAEWALKALTRLLGAHLFVEFLLHPPGQSLVVQRHSTNCADG
mmetsp:Transcript_153656/g.492540  ORF Transcript_153656/g.492540 Transcript_153656/m.492540 type:complete len:256 (+) Transcript_153656:157-924(+)